MKLEGTAHTDTHFVFLYLPEGEMDMSRASGLNEENKEGRLFAPLQEAPDGPRLPFAYWYARNAFPLELAEADATRAAQSTGDDYLERAREYVAQQVDS